MIEIEMHKIIVACIIAFSLGAWISGAAHAAYFNHKMDEVNCYNEETLDEKEEFD
jgi:hypothetical protein